MPPITYKELFDKRLQGKDLYSRKFGEKKDMLNKDEQKTLEGLWKALDNTIKNINRGKSGLNTLKLAKFRDSLDHLFRDPSLKQEHTEQEKQEYKWDKEKPKRPLTYEYRNEIENAICGLSELEGYLGQRVDKQYTNAYNVILDEANPEDSLIIEDGFKILNDVLQLGLPLKALGEGKTCKMSPEKETEWNDYKKDVREGQEKRQNKLKEWEKTAREYEANKKGNAVQADKLELQEIREKDQKIIEEEKIAQAKREEEEMSPQQKEELERKREAEAREKALGDRQKLISLKNKSVQRYKDPKATADMKKINMAMAAAFQGEIDRMGKTGEVPLNENDVKRDMDAYYKSAAFAIADLKGTLNELTDMDPKDIRTKITEMEQEVQATCPEGAPDSWLRAGKLYRQFDATWRIKKSSEQYNRANDAMRRIAEKGQPATRAEQYVAVETVKAYVAKNINKAKSATGRERMAISLAFLKQTMTPRSFELYCNALDAQRRAAGDLSPNRRIDPRTIGTVDEVYEETRERIRKAGEKGDGAKPDPKDLAMLTALSRLKEQGGRTGGDKVVEQRALQEEMEKVQNDPRFRDAVKNNSAEELIDKAWYGSLKKLEGYAAPAPTGPVEQAEQVQL